MQYLSGSTKKWIINVFFAFFFAWFSSTLNRISSQYFCLSSECRTEFLKRHVLGCHETPLSLCRPPVINRSSAPSTPDPFFLTALFLTRKMLQMSERLFPTCAFRVQCALHMTASCCLCVYSPCPPKRHWYKWLHTILNVIRKLFQNPGRIHFLWL